MTESYFSSRICFGITGQLPTVTVVCNNCACRDSRLKSSPCLSVPWIKDHRTQHSTATRSHALICGERSIVMIMIITLFTSLTRDITANADIIYSLLTHNSKISYPKRRRSVIPNHLWMRKFQGTCCWCNNTLYRTGKPQRQGRNWHSKSGGTGTWIYRSILL